jgi:hypothetical protein
MPGSFRWPGYDMLSRRPQHARPGPDRRGASSFDLILREQPELSIDQPKVCHAMLNLRLCLERNIRIGFGRRCDAAHGAGRINARQLARVQGRRGPASAQTEPTMVKVLALLIAVTMSCGVAAAVTISLAPPSAEQVAAGY